MSTQALHERYGDVDPLVEAFAAFFENYGVRRTIAIVWTYVFLSPVPLGQRELGILTGLSTGMVSTALQQLETWEAVHVSRVEGSRRLHYEAESDLLPILRRVMRERDVAAVSSLRDAIDASRDSYRAPLGADRIKARLDAVHKAADTYITLFHAIEGVARLPSLVPRVLAALRALDRFRPAPSDA